MLVNFSKMRKPIKRRRTRVLASGSVHIYACDIYIATVSLLKKNLSVKRYTGTRHFTLKCVAEKSKLEVKEINFY